MTVRPSRRTTVASGRSPQRSGRDLRPPSPVAATDIINKDGTQGRARQLDDMLRARGVDAGQPIPAVRMATALFCYSLVPRAQAKQ